MRILVPLIFLLTIPFFSVAQNSRKDKREKRREHVTQLMRQDEEGVITYRKSFDFGIQLTNDGYGFSFEKGIANSTRRTTLYQLTFTERKDHKEEKLGGNLSFSNPFVYGKVNFFYPVRLGVQEQYLLGNKSNKNGVSVTGNVGGGFVAGLLRPYYVQVVNGNTIDYVKYNSPDSALFISSPIGGPSLSQGWGDLKVTPGLYTKAGLRFDYGRFNEIIAAIEVGIVAEYYTKPIQIMLYNKEHKFFFGSYFTLLFGKRK